MTTSAQHFYALGLAGRTSGVGAFAKVPGGFDHSGLRTPPAPSNSAKPPPYGHYWQQGQLKYDSPYGASDATERSLAFASVMSRLHELRPGLTQAGQQAVDRDVASLGELRFVEAHDSAAIAARVAGILERLGTYA